MTNRTALAMRLEHAQRELQAARNACAHWDLEEDPEPNVRDCCDDLLDAKHAFKVAKRALNRTED